MVCERLHISVVVKGRRFVFNCGWDIFLLITEDAAVKLAILNKKCGGTTDFRFQIVSCIMKPIPTTRK